MKIEMTGPQAATMTEVINDYASGKEPVTIEKYGIGTVVIGIGDLVSAEIDEDGEKC